MSVYNLSCLHILSTPGLLSPKHLQVDSGVPCENSREQGVFKMTWHGSTTREGLLQVPPRVQRPSLSGLDSGLWEEHTQVRV